MLSHNEPFRIIHLRDGTILRFYKKPCGSTTIRVDFIKTTSTDLQNQLLEVISHFDKPIPTYTEDKNNEI